MHDHAPVSLDFNYLCGKDQSGLGTYTSEGINKLCEAVKASPTLTSLRCVPHSLPLLFVQRPMNVCTFPALGSLAFNNLTDRGKDMSGMLKLAEALPQSKLTSIK